MPRKRKSQEEEREEAVTSMYSDELERQLETIAYNGGMIKSLANTLLKRMKEYDCTIPESEQRCSMCTLGRVYNEVKAAAERAESCINSIDKCIVAKEKAGKPERKMPAEPTPKQRKPKIQVIAAPAVVPEPEKKRQSRKPKAEVLPDMSAEIPKRVKGKVEHVFDVAPLLPQEPKKARWSPKAEAAKVKNQRAEPKKEQKVVVDKKSSRGVKNDDSRHEKNPAQPGRKAHTVKAKDGRRARN